MLVPTATRSQPPGESTGSETQRLAEIDHDDSLILSMLARTPAERLQCLQDFVDGVTELRRARRVASAPPTSPARRSIAAQRVAPAEAG